MTVQSPICILQPRMPLPKQSIQLNDLDLFQPPVYIKPLFIYRNFDPSAVFMPTYTLVDGLRRALDQFPILYGRFEKTPDQRVQIQSSLEGIPVYEAFLNMPLSRLEPYWRHADMPLALDPGHFVAERGDPLLIVQITRFANNTGVAITIVQHHLCVDIFSIVQFARIWAENVRRGPLAINNTATNLSVTHNRQLLQGKPTRIPITPLKPTRLLPKQDRSMLILQVSRKNLAQLKIDAHATLPTHGNYAIPWVSSLDALSALIARAHLRLQKNKHDNPLVNSQPRTISMPIDLRYRTPKQVPANYFGNGTLPALTSVTAEEVLNRPIGYLAAKLRTTINRYTEETLPSMLSELANEPFGWPTSKSALYRFSTADICLTDWSKSPLYDVNFGHGPPVRFRVAGNPKGPPGCYLRMPPTAINGLEFYIAVQVDQIEQFKSDTELGKYVDIIG
ncbi:transferase [Syncephalis fuscata]|nr:transferase [Syncephalis fuscata]